MNRRAFASILSLVILSSCSTFRATNPPSTSVVDETNTSSTNATTPTTSSNSADTSTTDEPPAAVVKYSATKVGAVKDVVDLVERQPNDSFFYVVSRRGIIEKWSTLSTTKETVLDISSSTTPEGERGLLGLAFRKTANVWYAYINYTDLNGDTVIDEYVVSADGQFDSMSRRVVLSIEQPYANHNGGGLAVGPDNFLYIGMGDGGSGGDPERRARSLSTLLGKILRIDPRPTATAAYAIPGKNPFVGQPNARGEIWSIGLRNPWRFSFDSDGNLWIADVGQNKWEEVNFTRRTQQVLAGRGVDYGWSAYEGTHRYNDDEPSATAVMPVFEYAHVNGNCSISGSAVATKENLSLRAGWYYFGDFCSGQLAALRVNSDGTTTHETALAKLGNISGVRSISRGLYVLALDGDISRITATVAK